MRTVRNGASGRPQVLNLSASTLTRSGITATFTCTAPHDLTTGQKVIVKGANLAQYNGTFSIGVSNSTTFTYTMDSDPGGSASVTTVRAKRVLNTDQYDPFAVIDSESGSQMTEPGGGDGGKFGGRFVVSTDNNVTGVWVKLVCAVAGTISVLTADNWTNVPATIAVSAGFEFRGLITSFTCTSGTFVLYNRKMA